MKDFTIIEQLNDSQINRLYQLCQSMWWSRGRTMEDLMVMLRTCLSFGLIKNDTQELIGYARVLTDEIKFAFIFDVMTDEAYRGIGLGKMLINAIIAHPKLNRVKNFELTCAPDMVDFYKQFGFSDDYGKEVRPMRATKT